MTLEESRPRHRGRRLFAVGAVLLAAFFSYRLFYVYTVRIGSCAPPEARTFLPEEGRAVPPMRVVSWNVQGHAALMDGDHVDEVARAIRALGADVVALNEIHRGTWQARFRDHAAELARRSGMQLYFGRSYHAIRGDYGNAILTNLPVRRVEVHPLPSVGEPRSLLEARVVAGGEEIAVFVTHLVAWGGLRSEIRKEQIACITAHLEGAGAPWILMGDLNAAPDAEEIRSFITSRGVREAGPRAITHRLMARQLDYILADAGFTIADSTVVEEGPSDHMAVMATLSRPPIRDAEQIVEP